MPQPVNPVPGTGGARAMVAATHEPVFANVAELVPVAPWVAWVWYEMAMAHHPPPDACAVAEVAGGVIAAEPAAAV